MQLVYVILCDVTISQFDMLMIQAIRKTLVIFMGEIESDDLDNTYLSQQSQKHIKVLMFLSMQSRSTEKISLFSQPDR